MIDIKEATKISVDFLKQLPGYEKLKDPIRVEEVEKVWDDEREVNAWLITLSFSTGETTSDLLTGTENLIYKTRIFKISIDTGEVISMLIKRPKK